METRNNEISVNNAINRTNEEEINKYEPDEDHPLYLDIDGKRIWVNEDIYSEYKRPLWTEWKNEQNRKRRMVSNGRGGLKRCKARCENYSQFKNGKTLSIDKIYEEYELELSDNSPSIIEALIE